MGLLPCPWRSSIEHPAAICASSSPPRNVWEANMLRRELAAIAALALISSGAAAQDTVKIGLILPMTGQQASTGKQIDAAVKLYMAQNGNTVAGKKIEVILKDDGAVPDNTKRLAQELIVNDKVRFIAGLGVTPAAPAAAPPAAPGNGSGNLV